MEISQQAYADLIAGGWTLTQLAEHGYTVPGQYVAPPSVLNGVSPGVSLNGVALPTAPPGSYQVMEAGLPLAPVLGAAAAAALGALFGGQDGQAQIGPVGDIDLYGHAGIVGNGGGVPVGGPGVPEPPAAMVAKQWKIKAFSKTVGEYWVYFFRLIDGRIMCWNAAKKTWKMWRPKKPIVLYRGKVTLSQAVKAQRMLDRLWKTVAKRTKALKLA